MSEEIKRYKIEILPNGRYRLTDLVGEWGIREGLPNEFPIDMLLRENDESFRCSFCGNTVRHAWTWIPTENSQAWSKMHLLGHDTRCPWVVRKGETLHHPTISPSTND